jgi:hypothetical protein
VGLQELEVGAVAYTVNVPVVKQVPMGQSVAERGMLACCSMFHLKKQVCICMCVWMHKCTIGRTA